MGLRRQQLPDGCGTAALHCNLGIPSIEGRAVQRLYGVQVIQKRAGKRDVRDYVAQAVSKGGH